MQEKYSPIPQEEYRKQGIVQLMEIHSGNPRKLAYLQECIADGTELQQINVTLADIA